MGATTHARRLFACPRARYLLCLVLLSFQPEIVEGFAVAFRGRFAGIHANDDVLFPGDSQTRASGLGAPTCASNIRARASSMMSMGPRDGGGNEHKDKRDQREETEDSSGSDEGLLSDVQGRDWRLFRKNLISRYGENNVKTTWDEKCWAHEIGKVEPGSLLLATEVIWDGPFHQSVILVLSHDDDLGTVGLILNRPGPQHLHSLAGLKSDLAEVFGDSQVFDGGPVGLGTMTVVHAAERAEGSETIMPGVYAGGFDSLVNMARECEVVKDRVRFVHGHSAWAPGQLQGELDRNQWFVAAVAPELVTEDCYEPTNPLWGKVLRLMGGSYESVAKRNEPMS